MDKFLFTDGTNGVKEAQSQEELENFIAATGMPEKIKVWIFSANEWISYAAYRKLFPRITRKENNSPAIPSTTTVVSGTASKRGWVKKSFYMLGAAVCVFLVFNFTKMKWEEAAPLSAAAARPANVPLMDMDSLIADIEEKRGITIDKNTRNNLRLRNTWPDRILLSLNARKETSGSNTRFSEVNVIIDNTTGVNLDKAVVKLSVWKNNKISYSDTLRFGSMQYDKTVKRELDSRYKGDSLSVSFESIKAKAFNFCYSASVKNNSGNYNDRWFCRN